jgi:hypothetical protein
MVRWTLPDGSRAWGEDQDTWSPRAWKEQYLANSLGRR